MYDYGLSTLEQYGLTAESTARTRGGLLCHTEKGLVIVKEFKGTEKKLQKQQELLLQIQSQGGKVDCYIPNQEENLVSRDRDGIPYTMQYWYEGRECDTRSKEAIFKICNEKGISFKNHIKVSPFELDQKETTAILDFEKKQQWFTICFDEFDSFTLVYAFEKNEQ